MWESEILEHKDGVVKYNIRELGKKLTYFQWIENMKTSEDFIAYFNDMLKNSPYEAFYWEVKPVTRNHLNSPFEFVIVDSKSLSKVAADAASFQKYFSDGDEVVSFSNLGGDASE